MNQFVPEHIKRQNVRAIETAISMLKRMASEALDSNGEAHQIIIRMRVKGQAFGDPIGAIEKLSRGPSL